MIFVFLIPPLLPSHERGQSSPPDLRPTGSKHTDQLAVFCHHGRQPFHPTVRFLGQELPGLLHWLGYDRSAPNPSSPSSDRDHTKLLSCNFENTLFKINHITFCTRDALAWGWIYYTSLRWVLNIGDLNYIQYMALKSGHQIFALIFLWLSATNKKAKCSC